MKDPEVEKWLAKNNKKNQHWQVKSYLDNLRLPFKERFTDSPNYMIDVDLFGVRFRFDGKTDIDDYGWDIIQINQKRMDKEPYYFGEDLVWNIIDKGYFSYLREVLNSPIFRKLIIDSGWGTKILEKRIELAGKQKKYSYIRQRSEDLLRQPMSRVLSLNSGLFDHLM
jgi:hypothetical protein